MVVPLVPGKDVVIPKSLTLRGIALEASSRRTSVDLLPSTGLSLGSYFSFCHTEGSPTRDIVDCWTGLGIRSERNKIDGMQDDVTEQPVPTARPARTEDHCIEI